MTDNLIKRLMAAATGAGNLPKDLYRKDCADALAEIERLREALELILSFTDEVGVREHVRNAINQQQPNKD